MGAMYNNFTFKNDKYNLNNYRPITITNIAYEIWTTVITNRIKPHMDCLATEFRNEYNAGMPKIGVLYLLSKQIQRDGAVDLILLDLSKAFDTTSREILRNVLYGKGLPSNIIKIIRMGHMGPCLRAKIMENRAKTGNDKGVFTGVPLSACIFIIYAGSMMGDREIDLGQEARNNTKRIK